MTGEDLADALPQAGVQLQHTADVRIGVLVVGIEAGQKGMEALALLGGQTLVGGRDEHVGSAVPIGIGVITGVITRTLGLVLVPFLGHRNTGEHHMIDVVFRHFLQQFVHAGTFLEKVDVVQVGVAVAVFAGLGAADDSGTEREYPWHRSRCEQGESS